MPAEEKDYILDAMPAGYELRLTNASSDKKDYAMFGHPYSRTCRYRTSGDFALHLLWLCSDSQDWADCSCEWCPRLKESSRATFAPQNQVGIQSPAQIPAQGAAQPPTQPVTGIPNPAPVQTPVPVPVQPPVQAPVQTPVPVPVQPPVQAPVQAPAQAPAHTPARGAGNGLNCDTHPSVVPAHDQTPPGAMSQNETQGRAHIPPQSSAQNTHARSVMVVLPGTSAPCNIFRAGEMVWTTQGNAWRLGVILSFAAKGLQEPSGDDSDFSFTVAPLSHALLGQGLMLREASNLQPFLTFSVPDTQVPGLANKSFRDVDWESFAHTYSQDPDPTKMQQKRQLAGLEASKLAAKCVNNSYSTFNAMGQIQTPDGDVETRYGGIFLGAEMVQVGDPVRVTASDGMAAVMRVSEITTAQHPDGSTTLHLGGDIFRLLRVQHNPHQPVGVDPTQLGKAFVEEVQSRIQFEKEPGITWAWVMLEQEATFVDRTIQGRFYVTYRLMKNLGKLDGALQSGNLGDQQQSLNNRNHDNGTPYMGRQNSRIETFGSSVSVPIELSEGIVES